MFGRLPKTWTQKPGLIFPGGDSNVGDCVERLRVQGSEIGEAEILRKVIGVAGLRTSTHLT